MTRSRFEEFTKTCTEVNPFDFSKKEDGTYASEHTEAAFHLFLALDNSRATIIKHVVYVLNQIPNRKITGIDGVKDTYGFIRKLESAIME